MSRGSYIRSPETREKNRAALAGRVIKTTEQRFFEKVMPVPESGCWMWIGSDSGYGGYGSFYYKERLTRAHRAAYDMFVGPIPDGLTIDHLCRVPCCVNPKHLEAVTQRENNMRSPTVVSALNARKTHCPKGHEYSEQNLRRAKYGRMCRICHNEVKRAAYLKTPRSEWTHCRRGHEYTPENTRIQKSGARACKECSRLGERLRRERRKGL